MIKTEFLDTINYAICRAANEYLKDDTQSFFRKVGEYHLDEAIRRGFLTLEPNDKPLDVLIKIAKYLESTGYMLKISINKLSDKEAIVEMRDVSVTQSSAKLLKEKRHPSHFMTNTMFAALRRLGVEADLRHMEYDEAKANFREYWKIL